MTSAEGTTTTRRRVVVGVDGSESSLAALRWAVRQAELTGAPLEIVSAWEWPVLEALSETADLIVVGSHGHGEFVGVLLGSVSEHCVTHCNCPVVVIRGTGRRTRR